MADQFMDRLDELDAAPRNLPELEGQEAVTIKRAWETLDG